MTIPGNVTSIGDYAFHYCTSLASVTIPASVTSIGKYAFLVCTSLTSLDYDGTKEEWENIDRDSASYLSGKKITGTDGKTWTAQ